MIPTNKDLIRQLEIEELLREYIHLCYCKAIKEMMEYIKEEHDAKQD